MVVTSLCIRLLLMFLVAHGQQIHSKTSDGPFLIIPSQLQLFEYRSVTFTCEGFNASAGWGVRNAKNFLKKCSNSTQSCHISNTFLSDSGRYWCESGGERSNTVTINVTGGSVILESPVRPVVEGESVTLYCKTKTDPSDLTADFYKDGLNIGRESTGKLTIDSVSKSNEGRYNCEISGAGASPESWMSVKAKDLENTYVLEDHDIEDSNTQPPPHIPVPFQEFQTPSFCPYYIALWTCVSVVMLLLLLVLALLYWKKKLERDSKDLYAPPLKEEKKTKEKKTEKGAADGADRVSLSLDANPQREAQEPASHALHSTFLAGDAL